jgi:hypothetical protein
MKRIQSTLSRALGRRLNPTSSPRKVRFAVVALAALACSLFIALPTVFLASWHVQKSSPISPQQGRYPEKPFVPYVSEAVAFVRTRPVSELRPEPFTPEQAEKFAKERGDREKNAENSERVKEADGTKTAPFTDPAINNFKYTDGINTVTNPIANFDGPDMDAGAVLFGGRFAPPDTNAAVGPNHVVAITNGGVRIYDKVGTPLTAKFKLSDLLVGVANAADDDGDPVVNYDPLADRWIMSQFNLRVTANSTHQHVAVSQTSDPTGAYFGYDFLLTVNRPGDYPHMGVWPDGYYFSTNDFSLPVFSNPFQGAGLYALERNKMLVGDPTAKIIGFNTNNTHGGMLPSNLQGFTAPPVGTPNLFGEFDADEFGAAFDLIRFFSFHADFAIPANSTLTQGPDIATAAFDARQPASRANVAQPAPGEGLDSIADRLMHAQNFRVLAGGVQSIVLNFTVNVSGVNPTSAATYQTGVRWMELRRNAGTGAVTINQDATYAPGSGNPTGRDLWMAGASQDGEGNIGLAASASGTSPALNPTAIYTGRLPGDPLNTLPQGEVDAMSAVTRGVQTATANRWGDYSSLFVDPADECTFWGAFEYVDPPSSSFDWNTRVFSFKVNPTCVTAPRGTINGTVTNCSSGLPIQNAIVTTPDGFFRQTNAAGQFSMTVAPGTYTVSITKATFSTCTQTVTVAANGTATVNCCLAGAAAIVSAGATLVVESCTPANGALDPGETVTVSLCVQNTGGANTTALMGTLQASGGVTNIQPPNPQNYGIVVAAGPAVCRNFTFTANGVCGGTVTATLALQDGATNLGNVTYTFTLGVQAVALSENFDGVVAPALPAGWVATENQDVGNLGTPWATNTTTPDTAPNSVFTNDPSNITDQWLDTPTINITSAGSQLSFRNNYNLESTFDGGVVEISSPNIAAGAFTDITAAAVGGSFVSNGYNATISGAFGSPIANRQAFSGSSAGYLTTLANLGANVNGQAIKIRFRMGSDNSVSAVGWRVDTVRVTSGFTCCVSSTPCAEAFDTVTPPALPTGWAASSPVTCVNSAPWATSNSGTLTPVADTPPNSAFVNDPNCISDERLDSPNFSIVSATAVMTFRQNRNLESGFDGVVLEVSINAGAFQDILAAGATFGTNGYNATISNSFGNPIGGRMAWSGSTSSAFVTTTVNLPASANGQSWRFRWRRGSDSSASGLGFRLDSLAVAGSNCGGAPCVLTCPANITKSNDPNQCGAVVTYPAPTSTGTCGTVTCTPASGSFFPVGTTTVTCTSTAGPTCNFTVKVNDTQPPVITCPPNQTAVTDQNACPAPACVVATFPAPVASDNCPGVVVVCNPPSGSCFPTGTTTVTCTATDASGNTATCSFTLTTFDTVLQDDSNPAIILLWDSNTGSYRFCCNGITFTGVGKATKQGCVFTLQTPNAINRRLVARVDKAVHSGTASLQAPPGTTRCTITDRNTLNDTNLTSCQ